MLVKNLLLSTVLTAAVSLGSIASADDAYSPKQHQVSTTAPKLQPETVMVFAEVIENKKAEHKDENGLSVKVGGKVDVQYGFTNQKSFFKNPSNNENLRQYQDVKPESMPTSGANFTNQSALVSNGEITISAEKKVSECEKYGVEIISNANASVSASGNPNFASKVYIYTENGAGRFEVGANDGVNSAFALGASKIAKGAGGIDGDYSSWIPYVATGGPDNVILQDTFLTTPALPYAAYNQRNANKITYYTPTYNGFKAGISYIPDSIVQGTIYEALSFKGDGFKNVIEGGLSYGYKFDEVSLDLSLNGQTGQARDAYISRNSIPLKQLSAWEVGGQVSYDAFTLAASYGDWTSSGTLKNVTPNTPSKIANFWTAGLAYDYQDKGGISLTYVQGERRGAFSPSAFDYIARNQADFDATTNQYNALSIGGEYKVMEGLMPYAEFTSFNYNTNLVDANVNKGSVVLAGVRLNF